MSKVLCNVYRSASREGMYLYVKKADELKQVPEALLKLFGRADLVMTMIPKPEQALARVTGQAVLNAIEENGYYLQMPLVEEDEMSEIAEKNSKLNKLA